MEILTVEEVAKILHVNPQSIRMQAEKDVRALGFPCSRIGQHTVIPKKSFYKWLLMEEEDK